MTDYFEIVTLYIYIEGFIIKYSTIALMRVSENDWICGVKSIPPFAKGGLRRIYFSSVHFLPRFNFIVAIFVHLQMIPSYSLLPQSDNRHTVAAFAIISRTETFHQRMRG